ncbi:hypothetical protein [Parasedimentitalea maritima]|uniref:hypothetical protein n=1 Tax=Parasedimentitalea maritima TaxID=2578117 RepID=UPI001484EB4E|nr:hypothetical protein [Zongyanglinia marina]
MTNRKLYLGPLTDNRRWDKVDIRADDVFVVIPSEMWNHLDANHRVSAFFR